MAELSSSTDNMVDVNTVPECPHGPMLLFSKYGKNKSVVSRVYACSAYRSQKDCSFSMRADAPITARKQMVLEEMKKTKLPQLNVEKLKKRFEKIKKTPSQNRKYCHTCNEFVIQKFIEKHVDHDIMSGIDDEIIATPTRILYPKSDSKSESQFHFSEATVDTLLDIMIQNKRLHVVCLGTPSIHEAIRSMKPRNEQIQSILLDIDHRYYNFYPEEEFIWFNMYNGYYFQNENAPKHLSDFIKNKDVMIIIDPPFGAKFEPLADTVKKLERLHLDVCDSLKYCDVMLISPYFREKEILNVFPMYHMSDYKVNYFNHKEFQAGGRKQGSPIRIFTSLKSSKVVLPSSENYWFCKRCQAWRGEDNKHCNLCNDCTSKNGAAYSHCTRCKTCVKPSWFHCDKCKLCCHPEHSHDDALGEVKARGGGFHASNRAKRKKTGLYKNKNKKARRK